MPTILDDNRDAVAMTEEEADKLFDNLSTDVIDAARIEAQFEKRIAALKNDAKASIEPIKARIKEKEKKLTAYIKAHPDRFNKPKSRKTSFGKYGVRKAGIFKIEDAVALLQDLKNKGLSACYQIKEKILKAAVRKEVEEGEKLAGIQIGEGEFTFYSVTRALIDEAKNK